MASTYPGALDSFVGAPYTDNVEFVLAAYANQWIAAITAIETTIGAGSGSTAANPLYSSLSLTTYSTIAARLTAAETTLGSSIRINSAGGNIQPVGTTAQPGGTGLAADAGHVHAGRNTLVGNISTVGQSNGVGGTGLWADAGHQHQGVSSLASGYGITLTGGDGSGHGAVTAAATLTPIYSYGATVYNPTGPFTLLVTGTLGVGTWFLLFILNYTTQGNSAVPNFTITLGSASGTFLLNQGGGPLNLTGSSSLNVGQSAVFPVAIQVTSPGSLIFGGNAGAGGCSNLGSSFMGFRVV